MKIKLYFAGIIALLLMVAQVQAQSINTVAGNGTASLSGNGGPALSASLNSPHSVAVDGAGNIYIADYNNNMVRKVDGATGIITTIAGTGADDFLGDGGAATLAALSHPNCVAVDNVGNVYVSDWGNGVVRRIDAATGIITTYAGSRSPTASYQDGVDASQTVLAPYGLTFDAGSNLYIVSQYFSTVRRVNASDHIIVTVAGDYTKADHYSGDGGPATDAAFYEPTGVAVDAAGNIYVADAVNARVRKVDAATGIINTFAEVSCNGGVALDKMGNIYVSSTSAQSISKITPGGTISHYAGNGTISFTGDGQDASTAGLYNPYGLTVAPGGEIFVADGEHERIRKIRFFASLPYSESFTPEWQDGANTKDIPNKFWKASPAYGNNSWRRYDEGSTAGWSTPTAGAYSPTNSQTYCCWSSARFHASEASAPGGLNLYIDLSASNGAVQVSFNYYKPFADTNIAVYFSSDGGFTFTPLALDSVTASGGPVSWNKAFYTITSTSPNSVISFRGKLRGYDFGMDQLAVLPACTGTPDAGQVSNEGANILCYGSNVGLTNYNSSGGAFWGYTYTWQQSTDKGATWSTATGTGVHTSNFVSPNLTKSTQYRYSVTCSVNGQNAISNIAAFTINAPVVTDYPYYQDFEAWKNGCDSNDIAGKEWFASTPQGDHAWRRDDDGNSGRWSLPEYYAYSPAASTGSHSARFHSAYTSGTGSMDLYVKLNGSGGTGMLSFDYINPSGPDSLVILLSQNKGATFTKIGVLTNSVTWHNYSFALPSSSANSVIRFVGYGGDYGGDDLGIDNLSIGNPSDPAITISADTAGTTCAGSPVKFTAAITNAGTTQTYEWKKNNTIVGTNAATYTDSLLKSTDVVKCLLTAAGKIVQSNSIQISILKKAKVTVRITMNKAATICTGTPVTFTAIAANQGSAPVYQWYKNALPVGTGSTGYVDSTLLNGDSIHVTLVSDAGCVVSDSAISKNVSKTVIDTLPAQPVAIYGSTSVNQYSYDHFSVDDVPGAKFLWSATNGVYIEFGNGSSSIWVDWGNQAANIKVKQRNACGFSANTVLYVTVRSGGCCGGGEGFTGSGGLSSDGAVSGKLGNDTKPAIYPNPAVNSASVVYQSQLNGTEYQLELRDASGKLLKTQKGLLVKGSNTIVIDTHQYSSGMYLVTITEKNTAPKTMKLLIQR